jgi:hypothetical protein
MFSAWDFHSWASSLLVVLFMGSLITCFSALVTTLISRIWGEKRAIADSPRMSTTAKESPSRREAA